MLVCWSVGLLVSPPLQNVPKCASSDSSDTCEQKSCFSKKLFSPKRKFRKRNKLKKRNHNNTLLILKKITKKIHFSQKKFLHPSNFMKKKFTKTLHFTKNAFHKKISLPISFQLFFCSPQNFIHQILKKKLNKLGQYPQTQIFTKLRISNYDKNRKLKVWLKLLQN